MTPVKYAVSATTSAPTTKRSQTKNNDNITEKLENKTISKSIEHHSRNIHENPADIIRPDSEYSFVIVLIFVFSLVSFFSNARVAVHNFIFLIPEYAQAAFHAELTHLNLFLMLYLKRFCTTYFTMY